MRIYRSVIVYPKKGNKGTSKWLLTFGKEADVVFRRAKDAVASLGKRLTHRNPNVQIFALEVSCSLVFGFRMGSERP